MIMKLIGYTHVSRLVRFAPPLSFRAQMVMKRPHEMGACSKNAIARHFWCHHLTITQTKYRLELPG